MSTVNLIPRDEFWANAEDFVQIKKRLNANQDTAIAVTRAELQEIVDQASEKHGIVASVRDFHFVVDGEGDMWSWDTVGWTWRWNDLFHDGFEEGLSEIQRIYGIQED